MNYTILIVLTTITITITIVVVIYILSLFYIKDDFVPINFDKTSIYIINLDKRVDRYNITSKKLLDYGYNNYKRFSAIDSNLNWDKVKNYVDINSMESIDNNYRKYHHELSKGAVGCYLSHYNLWNKLLLSNDDNFIIFEDDTLPTFQYSEIKTILYDAPKNWDIILFGGLYHRNNIIKNTSLCRVKRFYCTHAYIISKSGAKKLQCMLPIKQQVDSLLSDLSVNKIINIYGLIDQSWTQNPQINSTDIQIPII